MSSWKKAGKTNQRVHRERHQPEARKHLGLLEKKKDYRLRARDAHDKEDTLRLLRKRALTKNPDEFYHHMINSKMDDDQHHEIEKEEEFTPAQIQLMQTQDIKYITMKRTIESKKIARLQAELHMIDTANSVKNSHTFFVDDEDDVKDFDLAKRLDTHPSLVGRRTNRPRMSDLAKMNVPSVDAKTMVLMNIERAKQYKELKKRVEREKELAVIQHKMELKRSLQEKRMLKPKRIKSGTKDSAPIYQFKYERKR